MPSNVATRFTLGGTADTVLGVQLIKGYSEPIAPSTRDKIIRIPGRHGEYDYGADLSSRIHKLDLEFVDATTRTELQAAVRVLADHLTDDDGEPCDLALVYDKEPLKSYTVRYKGGLDIKRIIAHGTFTLQLYAADPFAYHAEEDVEEIVTDVIAEIEVTNDGTVSTAPIITIKNNGGNTIHGFGLELE